MTRNILLTTLDALDVERPLRYYSAQNEFGSSYCEAQLGMEASSKYILARFPIDEIHVIGEEGSAGGAEDGKPVRLKDAGALYDGKPESFPAFSLYRYRIAQYIDELNLEQQAYDELLPGEERTKLTDFINSFLEKHSERETKRLNRFFDELANNRQLYEQFRDGLFAVASKAGKDPALALKWANNYLYMQLKPSAKLEILPVNENVCACFIPDAMLEKREYWYSSVLDTGRDGPAGEEEINLYVSLGNDASVDGHLILNMLNILISAPGSNIRLKKIYRINETSGGLAGMISDNTSVTRSTDLTAAAHAFLNYGKTDMLVEFWENSGERNERISSLIYAARHVDVGISMCNMKEVQEGVSLLRALILDEHSWTEDGDYGLLFGVIAGCIRADYGVLLESGEIPFIELIKWAYRHQLYQQVLTLIESHAPTSLVNSGIFYYCDDEANANDVINLLARQRLELKPYEYYKIDNIDHYFIKNYDRANVRIGKGEDRTMAYASLRAQSIGKKDPERIGGHTVCSNPETVKNVLYAYYHLGDVRNKISHADYDAMTERRLIVSESDVSSAMHMMTESIEYFIMSYDKALEEVQGKNPKIVTIDSDDVRRAAESMGRERFQEGRRPAPGRS